MQTSRKISINFAPRIQVASSIQVGSIGDYVELKCGIKSKPIPKTMFWKDHDGRVPVIQSANYDMTMMNNVNDPTSYTMVLKIMKLSSGDVGDYFCHAENALGSVTRPVSVRMRNTAAVANITECCVVENVSPSCMDACSFYLDIEAVINRPECLNDFDKLMKCASDGSDHRGCCAHKDVPRKCLNWCRGEVVSDGAAVCALQHTKTIVGCFQENQNRLPGPPQNVILENILDDQVVVRWDPPVKNPATVEGYRVFWHNVDSRNENITVMLSGLGTSRLDARETSIKISGLERNVLYELVVKAGNNHGKLTV
jgi:DB module/Fibronectin type III domain/Immunoglobulin domain